jgi:crossover junction endodeoxyribonuclease RusA
VAVIRIDVLGIPAPKGSARAFVNRRTGRAVVVASGSRVNEKRLIAWGEAVRRAAVRVVRAPVVRFCDTPLLVRIAFRLVRPASHVRKDGTSLRAHAPLSPTTKPDIDKLARSTLDALTGTAIDDDSRIVVLAVSKEYTHEGNAGCAIEIRAWGGA